MAAEVVVVVVGVVGPVAGDECLTESEAPVVGRHEAVREAAESGRFESCDTEAGQQSVLEDAARQRDDADAACGTQLLRHLGDRIGDRHVERVGDRLGVPSGAQVIDDGRDDGALVEQPVVGPERIRLDRVRAAVGGDLAISRSMAAWAS